MPKMTAAKEGRGREELSDGFSPSLSMKSLTRDRESLNRGNEGKTEGEREWCGDPDE